MGEQDIFEAHDKALEEKQVADYLLSNVENILFNGVQLILNNVFRLTGFDQIEDDIFRQLVIARLSHPMSKSATVEYLKSHFDEDAQLHRIYRYLDKLSNFVVVADAGLMSQRNIALLESGNYKCIIGARIKNENLLTSCSMKTFGKLFRVSQCRSHKLLFIRLVLIGKSVKNNLVIHNFDHHKKIIEIKNIKINNIKKNELTLPVVNILKPGFKISKPTLSFN